MLRRNPNTVKLTKAYIESKVSQEAIMSKYLDIPIEIIDDCIKSLSTKPNQNVEKYVIMPNHIHILLILDDINVEGTQYSNRLGVFVSSLKRFTNKRFGRDLWQRFYYDNIIRDEENFFEIWQYIDENPIKWTLDEYYRNSIKR